MNVVTDVLKVADPHVHDIVLCRLLRHYLNVVMSDKWLAMRIPRSYDVWRIVKRLYNVATAARIDAAFHAQMNVKKLFQREHGLVVTNGLHIAITIKIISHAHSRL